eukprot:6437017-Amphidinium_carterae.2
MAAAAIPLSLSLSRSSAAVFAWRLLHCDASWNVRMKASLLAEIVVKRSVQSWHPLVSSYQEASQPASKASHQDSWVVKDLHKTHLLPEHHKVTFSILVQSW